MRSDPLIEIRRLCVAHNKFHDHFTIHPFLTTLLGTATYYELAVRGLNPCRSTIRILCRPRPAPGPTQPPVQWVNVLFCGWSDRTPLCWPPTPFSHRGFTWDEAIFQPICTWICISYGDLQLLPLLTQTVFFYSLWFKTTKHLRRRLHEALFIFFRYCGNVKILQGVN